MSVPIFRGFFKLSFAFSVFCAVPSALFASTEVRVTPHDLASFVHLVKPDETSLVLHERRGKIQMGPSLQFIGLQPREFEMNLNIGAKIVDLNFNQVRSKAIRLAFEGDHAVLMVDLEDQEKAIRSALGAISIKGVTLRGHLRFTSEGPVRLVYEHGEIVGDVRGNGLLKPEWVVKAVKKIALKVLRNQVERQLERDRFQAALVKGLVFWARFNDTRDLETIVPDSIAIDSKGLRYVAE